MSKRPTAQIKAIRKEVSELKECMNRIALLKENPTYLKWANEIREVSYNSETDEDYSEKDLEIVEEIDTIEEQILDFIETGVLA